MDINIDHLLTRIVTPIIAILVGFALNHFIKIRPKGSTPFKFAIYSIYYIFIASVIAAVYFFVIIFLNVTL